MSCGNYHAWGAVANVRKAFEDHSDTCQWPDGCERMSKWYHTTITGRWSLCDKHCPAKYRVDPIVRTMLHASDKSGQIVTFCPSRDAS